MRTQAAMEELVFSKYASDLAKVVKVITQLDEAIEEDLMAMGKHFSRNNSQYLKTIALFEDWTGIKKEIIKLTADGQSLIAKKILRNKSAAHARGIRNALTPLNDFSRKRVEDFDSAKSRKYSIK